MRSTFIIIPIPSVAVRRRSMMAYCSRKPTPSAVVRRRNIGALTKIVVTQSVVGHRTITNKEGNRKETFVKR
jgi:hypothetical protein